MLYPLTLDAIFSQGTRVIQPDMCDLLKILKGTTATAIFPSGYGDGSGYGDAENNGLDITEGGSQ